MEFWDALEDSQYLDAVASVRDGPKPICKWEIPTEEQLVEWEGRVRSRRTTSTKNDKGITNDTTDASVEPLSLEWYVSSPIGFFFFSSFVKGQYYQRATAPAENGENKVPPNSEGVNQQAAPKKPSAASPVADEHAFVRMNFVEDLVRFQKMAKTKETRAKQVEYGKQLMRYVQSTIPDDDASYVDTEAASAPKMTMIRECDLKLPRRTTQSRLGCMTLPAVEPAFALNHDDTYGTNTIGLKGPLLQDFVKTLRDWIKANDINARVKRAESDSVLNREEQRKSTESHRSVPLNILDDDEHDKNGNAHYAIHPNTASISIDPITQKVEAIVYESLKRDYEQLFKANSKQYIRMRNFLWYQDRRVVYDDFYVMRVLGRGGFGLVSACQKGTTGKLYAMKVMSKRRIKMKKSVQFVMNERKALAAVSESPFVINLKYSLHSEDEVYLILDLMSGGDLGFHLHQKRKFGPNQCLYYAARIMFGLQALHDKGYVYRDLKPENCLLSEDGRVKLTDLGLATKTSPNLPYGVVGTRGYWAPEMHKRDEAGKRLPYNHVVDWFSFGCCLAEFIGGKNPFRSQAAVRFGVERGEKAKDKALDLAIREMDPEFDAEDFAPDAADLCRRLLDKDPASRLGTRGGCKEIMAHPWFKSVEWESIITDRKKPPFVPAQDVNAASQHEIGNFADDSTKATRGITFDESDEEVYKRWDWTNPESIATEVIEFLIYERELGRPLLPETMNPDLCCCNIL